MKIKREIEIYVCDFCQAEIGRYQTPCECGKAMCYKCAKREQIYIGFAHYTARSRCPECWLPIAIAISRIQSELLALGFRPELTKAQAVLDRG